MKLFGYKIFDWRDVAKFFGKFKSGTLIGAFAFALALWGYANLNEVYRTKIEAPLVVLLPDDVALDESLSADKITAEITGTGWELFNAKYLDPSGKCVLDFRNKDFDAGTYNVQQGEIIKGMEGAPNVENMVVFDSDKIKLKLSKIDEKKVPTRSNVKIEPKKYFTLVSEPVIDPTEITVRGAETKIGEIKEWQTVEETISGVFESGEASVALAEPEKDVFELFYDKKPIDKVELIYQVEILAEKTIYDLPVSIRGGKPSGNGKITPDIVSVVIRAGASRVADITRDSLRVSIPAYRINADTLGYVRPDVALPHGVELVEIKPNYLRHTIVVEDFSKTD